ncbi:hypothetical protein TUBRATIS_20650 [Tubulinosema ratisbonensis]|uniref:Uncharacterized protein n=1 Tax=Tubulinosema ratisbonensis TaxID=291195 RepID=A0A437AK81_9MICR|nr:hypothetical protein TUBRATIS_20650 [Tubulinosema ratisbonensis]
METEEANFGILDDQSILLRSKNNRGYDLIVCLFGFVTKIYMFISVELFSCLILYDKYFYSIDLSLRVGCLMGLFILSIILCFLKNSTIKLGFKEITMIKLIFSSLILVLMPGILLLDPVFTTMSFLFVISLIFTFFYALNSKYVSDELLNIKSIKALIFYIFFNLFYLSIGVLILLTGQFFIFLFILVDFLLTLLYLIHVKMVYEEFDFNVILKSIYFIVIAIYILIFCAQSECREDSFFKLLQFIKF